MLLKTFDCFVQRKGCSCATMFNFSVPPGVSTEHAKFHNAYFLSLSVRMYAILCTVCTTWEWGIMFCCRNAKGR